ncbi:MAG: C-GCAxxG-C-C family protein [Bacteroidaceae bacterium]
MYENRIARAVELFKSGYNCSQSVTAAFADLYGFNESQAFKMSASFGAGIGRMRLTCGAACGMFLLAGLDSGTDDCKDRDGKSKNYALVQALSAKFKERNGSLTCGVLLGLAKDEPIVAMPETRTKTYYEKRPCAKMVEEGARIFAEYLESKGL